MHGGDVDGNDVNVEWPEQHDGRRHQDSIGSNEKIDTRTRVRSSTSYLLSSSPPMSYVLCGLLLALG
jgi:hypothetical protein